VTADDNSAARPGTLAPGAPENREGAKVETRDSTAQSSLGAGVFEIKDEPPEFTIVTRDVSYPVPEDQKEIELGIYETWGVLKLLKEQGVFENEKHGSFSEFRTRLLQVARVGLTLEHVQTKLAAKALQQIRDEISTRKGAAIKLKYLTHLAIWATLGVVVGGALAFIPVLAGRIGAECAVCADVAKYGLVIVGSMAGAWMSVATTRHRIAFDEIPNFLEFKSEPPIRLLFVGLLAVTLALLVQHQVIRVDMAAVEFGKFLEDNGVALLLGVVSGISEKAVSVRIIERAVKAFTPSPS